MKTLNNDTKYKIRWPKFSFAERMSLLGYAKYMGYEFDYNPEKKKAVLIKTIGGFVFTDSSYNNITVSIYFYYILLPDTLGSRKQLILAVYIAGYDSRFCSRYHSLAQKTVAKRAVQQGFESSKELSGRLI